MPIDATHVGRTYPPTPPQLVTQDQVDAFARTLGAEPGAEAPLTFAMRLAAPAWQALFDDPELGLALARTVHADQGFDVVRALRAGDEVVASLTIDKVRSRGAQDFVTVSVVLTAAQERLLTATSTFVCAREVAA